MSTLLLKTGPFELHQGGTPQCFIVRTIGYPRNYFSFRFDGEVIVNSEHALNLRRTAPHIFKAVETHLQRAFAPQAESQINDRITAV